MARPWRDAPPRARLCHFEEWRDAVLAEEERNQHKLDRKIVAEEHWLRYGVSGRRKRNMRRVGLLREMREQRRTHRAAEGDVAITAGSAAPSGARVIEAVGVSKSYGGRAIVADFSTRIVRGDRIGIVGPNGSGKTTLISLLTGMVAPDAGSVKLGSTLPSHARPAPRQARSGCDGGADAHRRPRRHRDGERAGQARRQLHEGLFVQPRAGRHRVGKLSGGERGRLMLAQALAKPSNLLVLDEPTNDLDMETLDVLEETLAEYPGTILLISHDRDFLDRLVAGVIVPEGEGAGSNMLAATATCWRNAAPI